MEINRSSHRSMNAFHNSNEKRLNVKKKRSAERIYQDYQCPLRGMGCVSWRACREAAARASLKGSGYSRCSSPFSGHRHPLRPRCLVGNRPELTCGVFEWPPSMYARVKVPPAAAVLCTSQKYAIPLPSKPFPSPPSLIS